MIAPVALVGLDEVAREDLARVERDDSDFALIDDGEYATAGMSRTDLEVVETAASSKGEGALLVGDVIAKAEVGSAGIRWHRLGRRSIRFAWRRPADRPMGPLLVVGEAEGIELSLELGEASGCGLLAEVALEGLVEALDLALGLRVSR